MVTNLQVCSKQQEKSKPRPSTYSLLRFLPRCTREIIDLAAKHRLPAIYQWKEHAEAGGLVSYGPSLVELWRQAAIIVAKILRGAKPADLPVEQPTKFELILNARTARALGLDIPATLLARADEVIE